MSKQIPSPPRLAEWLLSRVIDKAVRYSALGDFEEQFYFMADEEGLLRAKLWYWSQVIQSLPSFIADSFYWSFIMFKNYLIVAFRNLARHKIHSFINILGLSVAIAFSILIFMFVRDEYSYDRFHEKSDRIVRVWRDLHHPTRGDFPSVFIPYVLVDALKELYPEVRNVVRLTRGIHPVRNGEDAFTETIHFASPEFFDVFSFPIVNGNRTDPLGNRSAIVITEEMARKYFGDSDPVGQQLLVRLNDEEHALLVNAVVENVPTNSSIDFDFLVHFEKTRELVGAAFFESWRAAFAEAYIELSADTTPTAFKKKLPALVDLYNRGLNDDLRASLFVQPFSDLHLNTDVRDEVVQTSDPKFSTILSGLGLLILFIAGVNFMTLSLGRSMDRAKEVGVRKVMGAVKAQLTQQYLGEGLLTSFLSSLIGMAIAQLILPVFNNLAGKSLVFHFDFVTLFLFILLMVGVGLAAGSYPAIVLAAFQPTAIFKGSFKMGGKDVLSKGLVVLQFSMSIFLIIATLTMREQLNFLLEKDLGYDRERVVEIPLNSGPSEASDLFERYKNELMNDERVLSVAAAMAPFSLEWPTLGYTDEFGNDTRFTFNQVTYDYLSTLGIEIVEGRDFSKAFGTDYTHAMVVNEAFAKQFGWQSALEQTLPDKFNDDMKIIAVVKDFHFSSLHDQIRPLVLTLSRNPLAEVNYGRGLGRIFLSSVIVRINRGETQPIVDFLRKKWQNVAPGKPFDLTFLDATIESQYREEQRWGQIIHYASMFAIFIACLGLFGLATLAMERRIKEISIRKVLGASGARIVSLVSKDLLLLVLVANILAWPAAYYALQRWLRDFAYRVDINAWIFALSSLLVLIIAAFTISYQALKTASTNPVKSLRNE